MQILKPALFNAVHAFARATPTDDFNAAGILSPVAASVLSDGYDPVTLEPAGWYIGGGGTNLAKNPNGEYAAEPSGGYPSTTPPPNWGAVQGAEVSLKLTPGTEAGLRGVYLDISGSNTTGSTVTLNVGPAANTTDIPVTTAIGDVYHFDCRVRHVSGSLDNFQIQQQLSERPGPGGFSTTRVFTPSSEPIAARPPERVSGSVVVGNTTHIYPSFGIRAFNTGPINCRLFVAQPQCLKGAPGPIIPIRPPTGTRTQWTRAADVLDYQPALLASVVGDRSGTHVLDLMLLEAALDRPRVILQRHDGSDANRVVLRIAAGSRALEAAVYAGGVQIAVTPQVGPLPLNQRVCVSLRVSPTGVAACWNGQMPARVAAAVPPVPLCRVGNSIALDQPLDSRVDRLRMLSDELSDAAQREATVLGAIRFE